MVSMLLLMGTTLLFYGWMLALMGKLYFSVFVYSKHVDSYGYTILCS